MKKVWKAKWKFFHVKCSHVIQLDLIGPKVAQMLTVFPVFCWLASFGWMWWEHLICSGWIQQLKPQHKNVHYSLTLGFTFKQLPSLINSKSRTPFFIQSTSLSSHHYPKSYPRDALLCVSDLCSHLCSFPSSHTSPITLLWIYFYFCSLLEGSAPRDFGFFFTSSGLCLNATFWERPSSKSY